MCFNTVNENENEFLVHLYIEISFPFRLTELKSLDLNDPFWFFWVRNIENGN